MQVTKSTNPGFNNHVTKYLVYNARKRGGDNASQYFQRTEDIAGVKDMRFQILMPDVLHWLGIKKIDNMISMSDMKHDAIVNSGIPINRRYEIPLDLVCLTFSLRHYPFRAESC